LHPLSVDTALPFDRKHWISEGGSTLCRLASQLPSHSTRDVLGRPHLLKRYHGDWWLLLWIRYGQSHLRMASCSIALECSRRYPRIAPTESGEWRSKVYSIFGT